APERGTDHGGGAQDGGVLMATLTQFVLPDLGEGLEEATVSAWLVQPGQRVALNEPIVEIETAKATVEIPSPHAGRIAQLHALAGGSQVVDAPEPPVESAPHAPDMEASDVRAVTSGGGAEADAVPIPERRREIADRLTKLVREVPMVTTWRTLDCTALEAFRDELGVGPLPVVVRALAEVCNEHRALNASYRPQLGEIW